MHTFYRQRSLTEKIAVSLLWSADGVYFIDSNVSSAFAHSIPNKCLDEWMNIKTENRK